MSDKKPLTGYAIAAEILRRSEQRKAQSELPAPAGSAPIDFSTSALRAADEIDNLLGSAVTKNTGMKYGFFAGVSRAELARIVQAAINAELPNGKTE